MTPKPDDGGVQGVYNFWLGLIPQFFGQLGAGIPAQDKAEAALPPGLAFPADQVARAATMTLEALQNVAQAYAPMLQAAGAPGLLGQWAAAMPQFPGMQATPTAGTNAVPGGEGLFNPWAAAMPFLGVNAGKPASTGVSQRGVEGMFNPWAAAMPFFTGAQAAPGAAGAGAPLASGLGPWLQAMAPAAAVVPPIAPTPGGAPGGMLPFQAVQQAWLDFGSRMAGVSPQSMTTGFDRTFGGLLDALGFGPTRKLQAAWQELLAANMAQHEARAAYAMIVQGAFAAGLDGLFKRLADMAGAGERVDSVLALLRLWAVSTEAAVHDVLQSEQGLAATAALSRAGVTHRRRLQNVAAIAADALDMATRRDLDDAYREIQNLKRELRALRAPATIVRAPAKPRAGATRRKAKS